MNAQDHRTVERQIVLAEVLTEAMKACDKWPPFNSVHEGYAVILEELDELWEESKKKIPNKEKLRKEAIQVAAMAVRFAAELTCEVHGSEDGE